jgi:DUF2934 family protein
VTGDQGFAKQEPRCPEADLSPNSHGLEAAPEGRIVMATKEQIRNYAHQLWEKAGRPEGRDAEFWHAAEVELNGESESPDAPTPPGSTQQPQSP